jgi:predicted nucleic acid-binding protein
MVAASACLLRYDIRVSETLFSEDIQHGRPSGDCTIVNPFF